MKQVAFASSSMMRIQAALTGQMSAEEAMTDAQKQAKSALRQIPVNTLGPTLVGPVFLKFIMLRAF